MDLTNDMTLNPPSPSDHPFQALSDGRAPRVSVLMAVFNTARFLPEALRSITEQTFADFEFIAIDDGSNDGSTRLLHSFAAGEPRMRLITRNNLGLIATRNELLAAAKGEFVAWMDSDDVSLPDRLARQVASLDANPELVCVGGAVQCIDPDGYPLNVESFPLTHEEIRSAQQRGEGMRFPATMMRREPALRVGGFREPFRMCEDLDLLLRLGEVGKLANLPDTLFLYRQHLSSVCAALGPNWVVYRDGALALARERADSGFDALQRGETLRIAKIEIDDAGVLVSLTYRYWADCALRNGNLRLAWRYAIAAIRTRPSAAYAWRIWLRVAVAWVRSV